MNRTRIITRTGLSLALVVVVQFFSTMALSTLPALGRQLITGSLVNLVLALTAALIGLWPGVAVGVLSSVLATLLGIGPVFPVITPFVAVSNAIYVVILAVLFQKWEGFPLRLAGVAAAAVVKAGFLWVTVPWVVSRIPDAKPPQVAMMTLMFSWPQAITALAGGVLCLLLLPVLKKAIRP